MAYETIALLLSYTAMVRHPVNGHCRLPPLAVPRINRIQFIVKGVSAGGEVTVFTAPELSSLMARDVVILL